MSLACHSIHRRMRHHRTECTCSPLTALTKKKDLSSDQIDLLRINRLYGFFCFVEIPSKSQVDTVLSPASGLTLHQTQHRNGLGQDVDQFGYRATIQTRTKCRVAFLETTIQILRASNQRILARQSSGFAGTKRRIADHHQFSPGLVQCDQPGCTTNVQHGTCTTNFRCKLSKARLSTVHLFNGRRTSVGLRCIEKQTIENIRRA